MAAATGVNLQSRLEARWRELQAAWAYLGEARKERKIAIDRWREKINATQKALELLLREGEPTDLVEHVRQCHAMFAKIELAKRKLDSTRKHHDATVADCETAFEAALMSDQLPLFGDGEVLLVGKTEVDGRRVKPGEHLYVRGRGLATVVGFRAVEGVEVVVLRNESGDQFEAIAAVLARDPPDDEGAPQLGKRRATAQVGDEVSTPQGEVGLLLRVAERDGTIEAMVRFDDRKAWLPLEQLRVVSKAKRQAEASA